METTGKNSLYSIFQGTTLQVPQFQRSFSWDDKHVEDLINDIEYLLENQDSTSDATQDHYFGTIVLQRNKNGANRIVDGQQRLISIALLVSSICQQMGENSSSEPLDLNGQVSVSEFKQSILGDSNEPKFILQDPDNQIFQRLVYRNVNPNSLNSNIPSQNKLINAKARLDSWVESVRDSSINGVGNPLTTCLEVIGNHLIITLHTVDEVREAGRIFETINDRGLDLSIADKIKSYLVYVSDRLDEEALGNDVFETFGEITRVVTQFGDEDDVEKFIKEHWRMFSGEASFANRSRHEITEIPRKIKKIDTYGSLNRPKTELINWIEWYLESLRESAYAYRSIAFPNDEYVEGSELERQDIMHALLDLGHVSNITNQMSFLMASNSRFGYSDKFLQLIRLLETFAFRAYEVVGASRQARRRKFREVSYRLYYADRKSILEDVFGAEQDRSIVYDNLNEGFRSAAREIENGIGNYGSDQQFEHNLKRYDVVSGGLNEDGWNGFRRKKSILYFLTRMNDQVFEKVERSEFRVPNTNGQEVFLEYIWPLDSSLIPADLQIEHQRQRRRLGNLAFTLEDYDDHEDLSYEQKFSRLYNNPDNPQMIRSLPDPSEGWDHTNIEERLEKMVIFALNSWEIKSGANIEVEEWSSLDMNQSEAEQQLRTLIRDNFDESQPFVPKEINHLPKIRINEPESFGPLTEKSGCPSCGSTKMIISEQNGSLSYKCTCGEALAQPSVRYYFNEY